MSEYIHLVGAEQVQSAGSSMRSAAEDMRSAANTISEALYSHQRFLDDWIAQFREIVEESKR